MKLEKTMLKPYENYDLDGLRDCHRPSIDFVGFDDENFLSTIAELTGYFISFEDIVVDRISKYYNAETKENGFCKPDILVVPKGYEYFDEKTMKQLMDVPLNEAPYIGADGLKFFEKGNDIFLQGFQLIRKLKKENSPIKNYLIFGRFNEDEKEDSEKVKKQAKLMGIDCILETPDCPYGSKLYEYLRNKNEYLFSKK